MSDAPESAAALDFVPQLGVTPSPADWRDVFIYFLLVDRFDDAAPATPPWVPGQTPRGRDPEQGRRFQGGNLRGVARRLDYIRGLGANAVWLSPILKNRQDLDDTYHGYGIQDFLQVDPRFGTLADLQALSREVHARGMYLILDVVINHTGDVWSYPGGVPYYYDHGRRFPFGAWRELDAARGLQRDDAVWPRELQDPELFKRKGEIRNWWDPVEARDGDFLSLKELDLENPRTLDTLIRVWKYWIAAADIDGFRIDTVKHMESSVTAIFCNAIREYAERIGKQNFFIFGEIVADDATIQQYIGRNSRIPGTRERFPSLDAALDFPLYFSLEEVIKGFADAAVLRERYDAFRDRYADHGEAGRYFVTFVDNHDQMARPYRRFMHANPFPAQAVQAMTFLLTGQGVPCIYYGTEQGFDGGGPTDAWVRECMFGGRWGAFESTGHHFFDPGHEIYQGIARIAEIRAREPALRYGRQYFREISADGVDFACPGAGGTLAWSRILDTQELLIALNRDAGQRGDFITVDSRLSAPGTRMQDLLSGTVHTVQEHQGRAFVRPPLGPHGIAILKGPGTGA